MCSGDEEVIAAAAAAAGDSPSARRSRRRRCSRRNHASVSFPFSGTVGHHRPADLSSQDIDLSVEDDCGSVSYLSSFKDIWADVLTWEELRSVRFGRVLKKYPSGIFSMAAASSFQFGSDGVGAAPVEYEVFTYTESADHVPAMSVPSSYCVRVSPDPDQKSMEPFLDFGSLTAELLKEGVSFESYRLGFYEEYLNCLPALCRPTDDSFGPALLNIPPTVFSLYVEWKEGGISLILQGGSSE